jgi:response regulator RpfG family c-di-GMP phosphodiesterase
MSFSEGSGVSSSPESLALGQVLAFFADVADYAAGAQPGMGERIAWLSVAMARIAGLPEEETGALFFAARLRNTGALGNEALAKGSALTERAARIARWDIPAQGARLCEKIAALPAATADIVRWQAECWDGTGYPDQLRWSGVPRSAQLLHIASSFVNANDPEEALAAISGAAGQSFAPEQARTFIMWFHTFGGEIEPVPVPDGALAADRTTAAELLQLLSARVDVHNGVAGRAERVARRVEEIGVAMGFDAQTLRDATLAALLYGIGEVRAAQLEAVQFDALSRLGVQTRAAHAMSAESLLRESPELGGAASIVRARAEWYDGTGGPDGLRHDAIPAGAQALAIAIAYDAMEQTYNTRITEQRVLPITRLETAAGTQFDPICVRALAGIVKAHA